MKSNVLQYKYSMKYSMNDVFKTIYKEQLKYFQGFDSKIKSLKKGTYIKRNFITKLQANSVKGLVKITDIQLNKRFEMSMEYSGGRIIQAYDLRKDGHFTELSYKEINEFNSKRNALNYSLVTIFYKFIFNRTCKKRMKYIEERLKRG